MVETQTGRKVKKLRLDNGSEYKNDPFLQICQDKGIVRHFTVRDTPQQNSVTERMNQTILEKVRCMLSNVGLGKEFWAKVVVYTCYLINHLPSTAIEGKTPIKMWTGNPATDYDYLHIFGSIAYYHVKEFKLDPRAKKTLFMGIIGGVKRYRLCCPVTKKIIFNRDVTFDESTMLKQKESQEDDKTSSILQQVEFEKVKVDPASVDEIEDDEEVLTQEPSQQQDSIGYRRPCREIHRPARFVDMVAYALPIVDDDIPSTYREGVTSKSKDKIEKLKTQLNQEFEMKDLVEVKKIIVMKICRDRARGKVSLFQKQYFKKVLQQFGMTEQTKPVSTPLASYFKLSTQLSASTDVEREYMLQVPYSNAVGSLMYAMVCTRPDISHAISITVDIGLLFERNDTLGQSVIGYVDSDYAGDLDKRRSTTRYVFTFAGGPISCKSTL
ncbi:Integrase catalytic domain-containing protein [Citrus sinensis]|nr:Integrase catalytic domain-containing protein [Citrus sinensis]